jgi:AcrR family transcriptional regulator
MSAMTDDATTRAARKDVVRNRERLLGAALKAVKRDGPNVPMADIAAQAGVGVATLYRHFPDRNALYSALSARSYGIVLDSLRAAGARAPTAHDAVAAHLDTILRRRDELLLPLQGGPIVLDEHAMALRDAIGAATQELIERGHADGSLRADLHGADVAMFAGLLATGLANVPDWDAIARRQIALFLSGAADHDGPPLPGTGVPRAEVERHMRAQGFG